MRWPHLLSIVALTMPFCADAKEAIDKPDRATILEFLAAFESHDLERVKRYMAGTVPHFDNYDTGRMEQVSIEKGLSFLSGYRIYNVHFRHSDTAVVIWSNGHELDNCFNIKSSVPSRQVQTTLSGKGGKIGVIYALRDLDCPPVAAPVSSSLGKAQ